MKLKCIGGVFDGRIVECRPEWLYVTLQEKTDLRGAWYYDATARVAPEAKVHVYTRRLMGTSTGERIHFLAPRDWSDFQAIVHQFSK